MINICSDKLSESRAFYMQLFDFEVDFDSDWFVHLISIDKQLELGIVHRTNAIVPKEYQQQPQGTYITFVVDNADEIFEIARENKYEVLEKPTDTPYGQRRLLLKDPNGMLVDISSPIKDFVF